MLRVGAKGARKLLHVEAFDCRTWCDDGRDRARRAQLCCALLDMHPVEWTGPHEAPLAGMGGEPEMAGGPMPAEDFGEGCPGSWYRCGFVASLMRYQRTVFDSGVAENINLTRCGDSLVHSAIRYLEAEGMRVRKHASDLLE